MKCPHCSNGFHSKPKADSLLSDKDGSWHAEHEKCPECLRAIIKLVHGTSQGPYYVYAYPRGPVRTPLSNAVPDKFAEDYNEACLVLADSPKASAALSRRCLQHLLREKAKVKPGNLFDEIQEVLDSGKLPAHLVEGLDAVRITGNFAAHPIKSQSSGEIVDVEQGEAEWNLDILEGLFDFYFVQPALMKEKRKALNAKLKDAGKPPMKSP